MKDTYVTSVENIGTVNRATRGAVTIALIYLVLNAASIIGGAIGVFSATVASIYLGLTALCGWDPLHAVLGTWKPVSQSKGVQTAAVTLKQTSGYLSRRYNRDVADFRDAA
jgi:hypothetical protein